MFAYSFLKGLNSIFLNQGNGTATKTSPCHTSTENSFLCPSCVNKSIQFQTSYFIIMLQRNV
ncbi:Uncharacterised protein [Mycobacterium tuberculosis]|nr:Uncharacterised protein [Mycobacterium tuberculosis]